MGRQDSPPPASRRDHQHRRCAALDAPPRQSRFHQALLPAPIGGWRELLQGAAAAVGEVGTRRDDAVRAVMQPLDRLPAPAAVDLALEPDADTVAGNGMGNEDGSALEVADSVAREADIRDIDLHLGPLGESLSRPIGRHPIYPFFPAAAPLS